MASEEKDAKATHRSPAYPVVALPEAIERLHKFWEAFTKNSVPRDVAMSRWGYKTATGSSARLVAALKQFSLLKESDGRLSITDTGRDIIVLPESSEEHRQALEAALRSPRVYREILETYGEHLPDRSLLAAKLIRDFEFNPNSVDSFIAGLMESLDYVNRFQQAVSMLAKPGSEPSAESTAVREPDETSNPQKGTGERFEFRISKQKRVLMVVEGGELELADVSKVKRHLDLLKVMLFEVDAENPSIE